MRQGQRYKDGGGLQLQFFCLLVITQQLEELQIRQRLSSWLGFRFYLSYENLILGFVPASGHRNTEDGDDGENDDVGDDARWCRDTDGGTEGGDDGDGDVVGERR